MAIQITEEDKKIIEEVHKKLEIFYPPNLSKEEFDLWDRLLRMIRFMDEEEIVSKDVVRIICKRFYETPTKNKEKFLADLYKLAIKKIEIYQEYKTIQDVEEIENTIENIKAKISPEQEKIFAEKLLEINQSEEEYNLKSAKTGRPLSQNDVMNLLN